MQDRPDVRELLDAVRGFLEEDVVPALEGPRQFHARVAANVLAIVGRELAGVEAPPAAYSQAFDRAGLAILASRDSQPPDHCSYRTRGGPWPPHCVAGSAGARFAPRLALPPSTVVVSKDTLPEQDPYSGFQGGDLDVRLREAGVRRVFVGGLATDYCVFHTVKDALARGYAAVLLGDAIRAVNVRPDDGRRAEAEMVRLGAVPIRRDLLAA